MRYAHRPVNLRFHVSAFAINYPYDWSFRFSLGPGSVATALAVAYEVGKLGANSVEATVDRSDLVGIEAAPLYLHLAKVFYSPDPKRLTTLGAPCELTQNLWERYGFTDNPLPGALFHDHRRRGRLGFFKKSYFG
jgi:hypothetical protein